MRLHYHRQTTFSASIILLPLLAASVSIDCSDIRADKTQWNLEPLDGPHSLNRINENGSTITNTTFTFNICRPLPKTKGIPADEDCPNNSMVCAIKRSTNTVKNETEITDTIPIAGKYRISGVGGDLDPKWQRLKSSDSPADRETEGVRLSISGGKFEKQNQKAFIDFICIAKPEERRRNLGAYLTADEEAGESGEEVDDEHGGRIKFRSWEDEGDTKVLRLEWHTQYACENAVEGNNKSSSGHWGFFTWFIIIVFMGVAAYLIFGSWLNYNRYSARGWDLVPHSDTIRDLPYLFRDWMRRLVETVQGGGSRGGYSAV